MFPISSYILISPLHADFRTVLRFSVRQSMMEIFSFPEHFPEFFLRVFMRVRA